MCLVTAEEGEKWRREIEESIKHLPVDVRWWVGTSVGSSSASIFAVFHNGQYKGSAREMGRGSTPRDASDFQRCRGLLDLIPEWRAELSKVADAYPDTQWPALVSIWGILESLPAASVSKILASDDPVAAAAPYATPTPA